MRWQMLAKASFCAEDQGTADGRNKAVGWHARNEVTGVL
jgi:hypothetical protein